MTAYVPTEAPASRQADKPISAFRGLRAHNPTISGNAPHRPRLSERRSSRLRSIHLWRTTRGFPLIYRWIARVVTESRLSAFLRTDAITKCLHLADCSLHIGCGHSGNHDPLHPTDRREGPIFRGHEFQTERSVSTIRNDVDCAPIGGLHGKCGR